MGTGVIDTKKPQDEFGEGALENPKETPTRSPALPWCPLAGIFGGGLSSASFTLPVPADPTERAIALPWRRPAGCRWGGGFALLEGQWDVPLPSEVTFCPPPPSNRMKELKQRQEMEAPPQKRGVAT